jgi:hypothetical protein
MSTVTKELGGDAVGMHWEGSTRSPADIVWGSLEVA